MYDKKEIIEDMKKEYLSSSRPWIIGYSGGKDSTCVIQLVYDMLLSLTPKQRTKTIHVLSTNTMVESPAIVIRLKNICNTIQKSANKDNLPIDVKLLRPEITDTFWVNVIGRGYPSPNKWFRWCTSRLKIQPMNEYILTNVKRNGEVLILLGARKSESASRAQTMGKHEINNFKLRKHGSIKGAFVYTPIEDMEEDEVWDYLLKNKSAWGDDNKDLYRLYKGENAEASFIIDGKSPPSGHSRFGCWTCTVVEKDKALQCLIDEGHPEYLPLLNFRNKLKRIRDDPEYREKYRKNQRLDKLYDEFYAIKTLGEERTGLEALGPFTMKTRHDLLLELLEIQEELRKIVPESELITPEEITAIELAWIYDGDDVGSVENLLRKIPSKKTEIDDVVDRLLMVEKDMSDVSRRIGVYSKLEKAVYEYTMNTMVKKE